MDTTRTVALWIANDEPMYRLAESKAVDCLHEACESETHARSARNDATEALATQIEEMLCDSMPCEKGVWGDLTQAVIESIDFEEIAGDILADRQIWGVYSSDSEDAMLFTDEELAREHLKDLCPESVDPEGEISSRIEEMQPGMTVSIDGTEYTLAVS